MSFFLQATSIFLLAFTQLWMAVPLGFSMKMNPWLIGLFAATGAMFAAWGILVLGESLRERILKKRSKGKKAKKKGMMQKTWDEYGVVGLGLLSPWISGGLWGVAFGLALGAKPKPLLLWTFLGISLCTTVLVLAGVYGVGSLKSLFQ